MFKYCHVKLADEYDEPNKGVLVQNHEETFFITRTFLDAFNRLGKDNWRMCGQSGKRIFYFMREINNEH
jgi:hypothetical protein